ncbi:MAG: hypothetical protein WCX83_00290 [Candidatus Cloacimonas sp.]
MKKRIYKKRFINYIINHCKSYNHDVYTKEDKKWFRTLAVNEYLSQEESIDFDDVDNSHPEFDAKECISYWEI